MGVGDDAGKVAAGTVDALKSQPLALALVIINLLFLAGGVYIARDFFARLESSANRRDELVHELATRCLFPSKEDH